MSKDVLTDQPNSLIFFPVPLLTFFFKSFTRYRFLKRLPSLFNIGMYLKKETTKFRPQTPYPEYLLM